MTIPALSRDEFERLRAASEPTHRALAMKLARNKHDAEDLALAEDILHRAGLAWAEREQAKGVFERLYAAEREAQDLRRKVKDMEVAVQDARDAARVCGCPPCQARRKDPCGCLPCARVAPKPRSFMTGSP